MAPEVMEDREVLFEAFAAEQAAAVHGDMVERGLVMAVDFPALHDPSWVERGELDGWKADWVAYQVAA